MTFAPNVTVPDSIAFSIALSNIASGGREHGIATQSTAGIGFSPTTVLFQETGSGSWDTFGLGPAFRNVQALVVAVPAPGSAVGFVLACCWRRRRRS